MEKETQSTKEASFEELNHAEQSKWINAQIKIVEKAINTHLRRSSTEGKDMYETREKLIVQFERIISAIG